MDKAERKEQSGEPAEPKLAPIVNTRDESSTQTQVSVRSTLFDSSAVSQRFFLQHRKLLFLISLASAYAIYVAGLQNNPPGFYVDESSIAYNAYTISQTGTDEYGNYWPIYFRAFGEYKNPVYIYILAAVFKVTGPSILAARLLSATLGYAAALLLGLIVLRLSGSSIIAIFIAATALSTPWLFEVSRLVFEVALVPLALIVFLLALHHAYSKESWTLLGSIVVTATLGLFTYTYSECRLLGPLLAIGLVFFMTRSRWISIVQIWLAYAVALVPLLMFSLQNPGALTRRFDQLSYIPSNNTSVEIVSEFILHYIRNVSLHALLLSGDPNSRHHVSGMGSILIATFILASMGIIIVFFGHRRNAWWRFVLYGLAVSVVPASLTKEDFHTLRLAAFPVFLLLFIAPTLVWMIARSEKNRLWGKGILILMSLTLLQAIIFQMNYHREGPKRTSAFDAEFPTLLHELIVSSDSAIYFTDTSYAHAYWYGTLEGLDKSRIIKLNRKERPPEGALVISQNKKVDESQVIIKTGRFIAYLTAQQ